MVRAVVTLVAERAGVTDWAGELAGQVTVRKGVNGAGRSLAYLLRYSHEEATFTLPVGGTDVLGTVGEPGAFLEAGSTVTVPGWGVLALEGQQA